jgi:hypothetical protein
MMLKHNDIYYLQERDGDYTTTDNYATPIAFVIDGEVATAEAFSPPIADAIFLANPVFTVRNEEIDGQETEVITATVGEVSTDMIVDELLTAVLLSNPTIVLMQRERDMNVAAGWRHDENGFYIMSPSEDGEIRINGMGEIVL